MELFRRVGIIVFSQCTLAQIARLDSSMADSFCFLDNRTIRKALQSHTFAITLTVLRAGSEAIAKILLDSFWQRSEHAIAAARQIARSE